LTPRKAALVGNFSRNLEQVNGLVSQMGGLALQGLQLDSINHYISDVQAVSASDVQRFAGTKLNAKESNIIIVGNAKEFLPELQKQFTDIEVIPIGELDLNNANLRKRVSDAKH
jgi:zinc protease